MAKLFTLEIYAADRNFYNGSCMQLIVSVGDGTRGVLADHEPMLIGIDMGIVRMQKEDESWEEIVVGRGSMQVANNLVTLLVETAEYPWEIDIRRAEEAKARAEEELRQKRSRSEYEASQASLARALSRLRAVRDVNSI